MRQINKIETGEQKLHNSGMIYRLLSARFVEM